MSEDNQLENNMEADTTLGEPISTSTTAAVDNGDDIPSNINNNHPLMSYFDSDKSSEEEISSSTRSAENTSLCKDDTTVGIIAMQAQSTTTLNAISSTSSLEEVTDMSNDTSLSTSTPTRAAIETEEAPVKTEVSAEINDSSNKSTEDDISTTSTTEDFHTPREELTPRISESSTPTSTTEIQPSSPDRISENDNTTIQQKFSDSPERTAQIEIVHSPPSSSSSSSSSVSTSADMGKEKYTELGQERNRESITDVDHSQSKLHSSTTADDNTTESETTENDNNIVQTAEKQAAIAAAISANMSSSMSPSVAAGIAKAWMSDKVTKVTEMSSDMSISNSMPGSSNYPPPPPPPRKGQVIGNNNSPSKQYNNNSPTMVALPPPTPLSGSPNSRSIPMRPVRFDDVKFAFCKLLKGDEEEKFDTPGGDDGVVDKVVDNKMDGIKKAEGVTDSTSGEDNEDSTKSVETSTEEPVEDSEIDTIEGEDKVPEEEEGSDPILSDSFLRFLLIVARVPIIVEEHKKQSPTTSQIEHNENAAATSAAGRAFELLCMIQSSYELISNSQQQSTDDSVKRMDATTSFFAACSGLEKIASDSNSLVDNIDAMKVNSGGTISSAVPVPPLPLIGKDSSSPRRSSAASTSTTGGTTSLTTSASSMASSVFSNVISKMAMPKKQTSFTDIGKKLTSSMSSPNPPNNVKSISSPDSHPKGLSAPSSLQSSMHHKSGDYECLIDNEMLGLTVENVLERTIIRTLLPDGAAKHAGAQVGSLIAKVGNVDTSNLTHFETIDELRRSQRPLKLTLRHIGGDTLRKAREEMGRLIRGHGLATIMGGRNSTTYGSSGSSDSRPWRDNQQQQQQTRPPVGETFDIVLNNRWPSRSNKSLLVSGASASAPPLAMTRAESMHQASKNLIRILALLIVGMDNELKEIESASSIDDSRSTIARPHLTVKELKESIEITSKILL